MNNHRHIKNKIKSRLNLAVLLLVITAATAFFAYSAVASSEPSKRDENGFALFQSFSGIEELKTNITGGAAYNILEILPEGKTEANGEIGYYIDGAEPIDFDAFKIIDGFDARKAELDAFINGLPAGLASATPNEAPITTQEYKEIYPWQFDTVGENDRYLELTDIDGKERFERYTTQDEDNLYFQFDRYGDYVLTGNVVLELTDGDTFQIIDRLVYGQSPLVENIYYYNPSFDSAFNIAGMSDDAPEEQEAILSEYAQENEGIAIYQVKDASISSYEYVGILGDDFSFDLSFPETAKNYFVITEYGAPSATHEASTAPYFAVHGGFTQDTDLKNRSDAYFKTTEAAYRYVGEGEGEYSSYIDEKAEHLSSNIEYSKLYVSTFINNDWFIKYVLDASLTQQDMEIAVTVKTASQVTQEDVDTADLIMVSQGIGGTIGTDLGTLTPDLSAYINDKKPLVVSNAIKSIVEAYVDTMTANDISLSKFLYNGTILDSGFMKDFSNPVATVLSDINNENAVRELTGVDTLPVEQTFANHIRHIVNYGYKKEVEGKTELEVLEIQPIVSQTVSQMGSSVKDKSVGGGNELTTADVQGWFGGAINLDGVTINITTMAITEFIGVIDEVIEKYDIVYIGSSLNGFNTTRTTEGTFTNYNDDSMDRLIYTNIGDIISIYNDIVGLLDVDYYLPKGTLDIEVPIDIDEQGKITYAEYAAYYIKANSTNVDDPEIGTLARASGYDLTYSKIEELQAFVDSGLPIIISDELMTTDRSQLTNIEIEIKNDGGKLEVISMPLNEDIYPNRISYQWYDDEVAIEGETTSSYTINDDDAGEFYCNVTFTNLENGESKSAKSNTVDVSSNVIYDIEAETEAVKAEEYLPITFEYSIDRDAEPDVGTAKAILDPSLVPAGATVTWEWRRKEYTATLWEEPLEYSGTLLYSGRYERRYTISDFTATGVYTSIIQMSYDVPEWVNRIICSATVTDGDNKTVYSSNRTGWIRTAAPADADSTTFYTGQIAPGSNDKTGDTQHYLFTSAYDSTITVSEEKGVSQISASAELYKITKPSAGNDMAITEATWQRVEGDTYVDIETTKDGDNYTANLSEAGTYRLRVKINATASEGYTYLYSNDVKVTEAGRDMEFGTDIGNITPPQIDTDAHVLNDERVDNSSKMWEFLMGDPLDPTDIGALARPNVMSESQAPTSAITTYANLSKPSIVYETEAKNYRPTEYTGIDDLLSGSLIENDTLSYTFRILNPTDLTPYETKYEVSLYLDADGDGRYADHEIVSGVSTIEYGGGAVSNYELLANNTYTVSRAVPANIEGAITWQLKIEKVGSNGIIATDKGITYKKPKIMIEIDVLQIAGDSSGATINKVPYTTYFNDMREAGVYDITVEKVSINDLNVYQDEAALLEYLNGYDMLFIGFQESYGKLDPLNGFDPDSAQAINAYIDSGKAVLFSHDNISTEVIPIPNQIDVVGKPYYYPVYPTMSGTEQRDVWFSGYFFNTLMRSATGLDRYGVTDTSFGLSQYNFVSKYATPGESNGITAAGYESENLVNLEYRNALEEIKDAGYDIAYEPGSQKEEYVHQTQGYSNYMITRSRSPNADTANLLKPTNVDSPSFGQMISTTAVSQVNKGQITSYPYNVNTSEFGGSVGTKLTVSSTHYQWTQLNVNAEDVTVWYCLSPEGTSYTAYNNNYNDVINNYYIYTKGNVTYTGAGHSGVVSGNTNEAQLFVNTMISAYRAAQSPPTIEFKENIDDAAMQNKILIALDESLDYDTLTDEEKQIPFVFVDENTAINKFIQIEAWYDSNNDGTVDTEITGDIFNKADIDTGQDLGVSSSGSLFTNTPYYIKMPEDLVAAVEEHNSVTIEIKVSVSIGADDPLSDTSTMKISKYGLLDLS